VEKKTPVGGFPKAFVKIGGNRVGGGGKEIGSGIGTVSPTGNNLRGLRGERKAASQDCPKIAQKGKCEALFKLLKRKKGLWSEQVGEALGKEKLSHKGGGRE